MKKIIFIVCLIILTIFIKIPSYVELNNLVIVEGIGLRCENNKYILYLKEVIPIRDDNGISYQYKYYQGEDYNINNAYKSILEDNSKKKFFFDDTKYVVTNCKNSSKLIEYFDVNPKYIKHTNNDINKTLQK